MSFPEKYRKYIYLLAVLAVLVSCAEQGVRPNILFLFADDWGKYASIYDQLEEEKGPNSVIKTPNIDRLAEQGVLFTNAFVPAPSCTPCRSSILSGQYFFRTGMGAILHMAEWDSSIPTYPELLREDGYHIGFTYKVWSPGTPRDIQHGGDGARYEQAGNSFNRFSQEVMGAADPEKRKYELLQEVRDNFSTFLGDRKPGQPFCYWFGPTNTHRSWVKGSGKAIWGIEPDDLIGKMPDFLPDIHEIREDFADYLGESQAWDAAVGTILQRLEETGEIDNTLIVISGDHGIPGFPRGKTNLYDLGTQVALAVVWPDKIEKHKVVHDMVNLMDLAPTFLDAAGVDVPEVMNGRSLIPIFESSDADLVDPKREWVLTGRERHVATARDGNLPYPQRAIRTAEYQYIRNFAPERWPIGTLETALMDIDTGPTKTWFILNHDNPEYADCWHLAFGKRPYEELYNIKDDPHEMVNVAELDDYQEIRTGLAALMDTVLTATGDPRMNPSGCVFDRLPYTAVNERYEDAQKRHEDEVKQLLKR